MHEASLVTALLQQVQALARQHGDGRVEEIRIEVGPLAGVEPVLLREAFQRLGGGTCAAEATLLIEAVELTCRCRECTELYHTPDLSFVCPHCGSDAVAVTAGDGVVLHSITLVQFTEATSSP